MSQRLSAVLVLAGVLVATGPVLAHHSFAGQFDVNKPTAIKGVVTKVDWINPHVYVYVDVTNEQGNVTKWSIETFGPGRMRTEGLTKATFGIGKPVTVQMYASRDGSNVGFLRTITFADGHTIEVWLGDPSTER